MLSWRKVALKINPSADQRKDLDGNGAMSKYGQIYFLTGDFSNTLVYRVQDGMFLYDYTSLNKLLNPGEINISNGYGLYSYYMDRQNNIWVCTAGGLIKIKLEKNLFTHYFTKEQLKDSTDNQGRGIYADEAGNVYAAAWNKFCINNGYQNSISKIGKDNIFYGLCRCMNKIYVGESNIYLLETGKKEVLKVLTKDNLKETWALDSLAPDKLLAGCTNGILTFDISTNKLIVPVYSTDLIPEVQFVYRFIKRGDKKIWAVAQNGLYLMNGNADSILDYYGKASRDPSHRLPFEILQDTYQDNAGIFWFATNGEGLFRWERNKNTDRPGEEVFRRFNSADGLSSDVLYRIESGDYGNLRISTDNGLIKFNIKDFKAHTYVTTDGISHNEFNRASSFKAKDGRLFFGALNGINAFYPKDFAGDSAQFNMPSHVVSFNQFVGDENKLVDKTIELMQQNTITLNPGDKFFTLEFQLLDFE